MKLRIRLMLLFTVLSLLMPLLSAPAQAEEDISPEAFDEEVLLDGEPEADAAGEPDEPTARDAFIDDIIALGKELYDKAGGKYQRAHYKGDIYVCKNFTVYVFRQARSKYRMAEFPDKELKIPNNLPAKKCKPYSYGYCWV